MSDTPPPPPQPPLDHARRYRIATNIIHSILDDRPPTATVSPSGELYRAIERFHRNVDRVRRELPAARPQGSSMPSDSERDLRRRYTRSPPQATNGSLDDFRSVELPSISANTAHTPSLPPLRSLGSRRLLPADNPRERLHWADLRMERHQRLMSDSRATSSAQSLERLEDANSHLRTLLDFTETSTILPSMPSREMSPPLRSQDRSDEGRRPKRRRLDVDRADHSGIYRGFRYGRYGQAEPGPLSMELVSCDGGTYSTAPEYTAENILRNDKSVYCTKGNRCNIILRHRGACVFSMTELVIKAPGHGFSAPVREGMVFVAMNPDPLFDRTAEYQIQHLTGRDVDRLAAERENRSMPEPPAVYSIQHGENGARVTRFPPIWAQSYNHNDRHQLDFDGDADGADDPELGRAQIAQLPREFTLPPPPFAITSECSSDDGTGDDLNGSGLRRSRSYTRLQIPNRIGALPFESDDDEEDGDAGGSDDLWVPSNSRGWGAFDEVTRGAYDRRRPAGSSATAQREGSGESRSLQQAREASQIATQEAVRAVGGDLMTPLVHFHLEEQTKCTIRFDPPVSGRLLLLKMWTSQTNIDIQGVTVKGLAGPRYVPDAEYR